MDVAAYQPQLNAIFQRRGVVLAYLFGSQARQEAGPLSDVDVAVLFGADVPRERWSDGQIDLMGDLGALFQRNDVDVVVLNRATPLLAHRVVYDGAAIYEPEPLTRVRFEVKTLRRYVDTAPLRKLRWAYLGRRVSQRQNRRAVETGERLT